MTLDEWVRMAVHRNMICGEYSAKVEMAHSRHDIFRILCDANGVSFIAELENAGITIPYDILKKDFVNFLNGKKIMEYDGYTSCMYCDYEEPIRVETTLVSLLRCKCDITVPNNRYPSIILNKDCDVTITLLSGARLNLNVFNGAKFSIIGDQTRVRVNRR